MTSTKMLVEDLLVEDEDLLVEDHLRAGWKTGAVCQIYSHSKKKWFSGKIAGIFTDEEGEWLFIRYDKTMCKQVQRYCPDIRPRVCVFSANLHTIHQNIITIPTYTQSLCNHEKLKVFISSLIMPISSLMPATQCLLQRWRLRFHSVRDGKRAQHVKSTLIQRRSGSAAR